MDHHAHHWGHHHGRHMHHHPFGHRPGMFFFPPLMLLFGLFVLFFIFKTGLWIPLLLIGALCFVGCKRSMSRWTSVNHHEWREKMKREWRQWQDERDDTIITPEKPKRDTTEYV